MKLSEVVENQDQPGTYAGVRFDKRTVNALEKFNKKHSIPNQNDNWHTTLLYSRKHLPNYQPEEKYSSPYVGTPTGFEIWPSQDKKNVLVLTFSCPQLYQRHHKLMQQHGGTYDFDTYKPHVTLSYDVGDLDVKDLPEFKRQLKIVGEYHEELDAS
jgi:2'-5' RNA ligase